jgi:hypothetical protein
MIRASCSVATASVLLFGSAMVLLASSSSAFLAVAPARIGIIPATTITTTTNNDYSCCSNRRRCNTKAPPPPSCQFRLHATKPEPSPSQRGGGGGGGTTAAGTESSAGSTAPTAGAAATRTTTTERLLLEAKRSRDLGLRQEYGATVKRDGLDGVRGVVWGIFFLTQSAVFPALAVALAASVGLNLLGCAVHWTSDWGPVVDTLEHWQMLESVH